MMKRILAALLITAVCAFAAKVYDGQSSGRAFEILRHNVNQVEMCVSNYGKFGQDETGNNAGCWWPIGTAHNYIYGAGSWFGTIDVNGDTLVTIGYGPHGGESEYAPGRMGWSVSDPQALLYMYPTNWPPYDPTNLPMAPSTPQSHQDSWCVYNDGDIQYHIAGDTRPIGLEVYQTVYAWNLSTTQDIIFIRFECKNTTSDTLTRCYFGVCADNDIGNESGTAANDRISGIVYQEYVIGDTTYVIDNLGYQWQEVEETGTPNWFPGTIGYDYLQSPWDLVPGADKDNDGIPDEYERDSSYYVLNLPPEQWDVDLDGTPDWRDPSEIPQQGMTAFKRFTLNLEPSLDPERYSTLAGYNFRTGVREPYDTVPPDPDDQRFLQCSGPFELAPDSTAIVLVGIVFANWHDIFGRPDSALVEVDATAQYIFDLNWLLPGPPPPPNVTLVPGDTRITLVWDDHAETTPDPYFDVVGDSTSALYDPYYRQYDFEGYRVWKSVTGQSGSWELLASYDLANGIVFEDTMQVDSIRLRATDTGIAHNFTDDDVRNGFPYYYAVTAFDYNYVKTIVGPDTFPTPVWFESGLSGDSVRARRDPANYVPGSYAVEVLSGNPGLAGIVSAQITSPLDMVVDPQYVDFAPYAYADGLVQYTADLLDAAYVPVTSMSPVLDGGDVVVNDFIAFQGMNVVVQFARPALVATDVIFDSVTQVSGTYPVDSLVSPVQMNVLYGLWAYRGNDYEVHWLPKEAGGLVNTVVVLDVYTGDTVPYAPFAENAATDSLANSWSFHSTGPGYSDTLVYDAPGPPPLGTKYLYICGGKVNLKNGLDLVTGDLRPSDGEVWHVHAASVYDPAPVYGRVQITPSPAYFDMAELAQMNVKVVPNPYVIANEWQTQFVQRRLKFINLPNACTIRIFNLNGELVRTLLHTATSEGGVSNNLGGDEWWDLLSENRQLVASGVYIFHIASDVGEQVGKFVIVN
jgi:hypothetical protein